MLDDVAGAQAAIDGAAQSPARLIRNQKRELRLTIESAQRKYSTASMKSRQAPVA
jgi:hypothetical protein